MGNGEPAINPKLVATYHEEDPNWQSDDAYSGAQTNLADAEKTAGSDSGRFEVDLSALENLSSGLSKLISDYFGPASNPGPSSKLDSDTSGDGKHFGQANSGVATSFAEADDLYSAYNQVQQNLVQLHDAVNQRLTDMQANIGQVHQAYQGAEDTVRMHATKAKDGDTLLTYSGYYSASSDAAYSTVQRDGTNTTSGMTADSSTTSTSATPSSSSTSGTSTQNNM
jgi:hypothetical protein